METQKKPVLNYNIYKFSSKEKILYCLQGVGIIGFIAYVFYHSFIVAVGLLPLSYFYFKRKRNHLIKRRKQELNLQFKEAILAISAGLQAGYSIENSFKEALKDLVMQYSKDSYIVRELQYIVACLDNNIILEKLLQDLALRSEVEDIQDFADIFTIAKRSGGDLNGIIRACVHSISGKIEVKREIYTIISAKQFEQKIMNVIPFFIILYINASSPGFFDGLYHNLFGIIIMSICLGLYFIAFIMAEKIVDVQV